MSDVKVDVANSAAELKVRQQKNDQFGVGQMARVVALPSWQGACPVQLTTDWMWFRSPGGCRRRQMRARCLRGWLAPGLV